jgi:hypothetical protein
MRPQRREASCGDLVTAFFKKTFHLAVSISQQDSETDSKQSLARQRICLGTAHDKYIIIVLATRFLLQHLLCRKHPRQ